MGVFGGCACQLHWLCIACMVTDPHLRRLHGDTPALLRWFCTHAHTVFCRALSLLVLSPACVRAGARALALALVLSLFLSRSLALPLSLVSVRLTLASDTAAHTRGPSAACDLRDVFRQHHPTMSIPCPLLLVPGAWCLVPGAWCLVPHAWQVRGRVRHATPILSVVALGHGGRHTRTRTRRRHGGTCAVDGRGHCALGIPSHDTVPCSDHAAYPS